MASVFKSYGTQNIGTTATTVVTAPTLTTSTIIGLSCANTSGSALLTVDVKAIKAGVTTYLIKNAPVAVGGTLVVIGGDQKVVLEAGNTIQVSASGYTNIDVFVSALEQS